MKIVKASSNPNLSSLKKIIIERGDLLLFLKGAQGAQIRNSEYQNFVSSTERLLKNTVVILLDVFCYKKNSFKLVTLSPEGEFLVFHVSFHTEVQYMAPLELVPTHHTQNNYNGHFIYRLDVPRPNFYYHSYLEFADAKNGETLDSKS